MEQLAAPRYDSAAGFELIREQLYHADDARERRQLFDAFFRQYGEAARDGVLLRLFDDLNSQEADEEKRLKPLVLEPRWNFAGCSFV